jgi:hypothetical protein
MMNEDDQERIKIYERLPGGSHIILVSLPESENRSS